MPIAPPKEEKIGEHTYIFHSIPAMPVGSRIYRRIIKAFVDGALKMSKGDRVNVLAFFDVMSDEDFEFVCQGILDHTECSTLTIGDTTGCRMKLERQQANKHFGNDVQAMMRVVFKGLEINYLNFLFSAAPENNGNSSGSGESRSSLENAKDSKEPASPT